MKNRTAFAKNDDDLAFFLDVDSTALETAAIPERVRIPAALRNTLQLACARGNAAVALLSSGPLAELDALFSPYISTASCKRGLEVRLPCGDVIRPHIVPAMLERARRLLQILQKENVGLLLEDKGVALALHFRLAPRFEPEVEMLMCELASQLGHQFVVRRGSFVFELAPRGYDEGRAIEILMEQREFCGRTPVFVSDDPAARSGFDAVNSLGGFAIRGGELEHASARFRFSSVATVGAWLKDRNPKRWSA